MRKLRLMLKRILDYQELGRLRAEPTSRQERIIFVAIQ
jgi:hypothetical protein